MIFNSIKFVYIRTHIAAFFSEQIHIFATLFSSRLSQIQLYPLKSKHHCNEKTFLRFKIIIVWLLICLAKNLAALDNDDKKC